jgi:DNA polymerase-3 subunit alpha
VVISEEPLTDIVPLQRIARDEGSVMVQHPMSDVEALGLLKVDFLGLRNLDVIEETLETIGSPPAKSWTSRRYRSTTRRR